MRQSKSLGSLATWPSRSGRSNSSKSNPADMAEAAQAWPTSADAYELLDECGKGVSAEVYRARCLVNNRIVGIKALNLEWLMTPLDEVMHEAQIMKAYKHDNILPLYCSFVTGQELWMVMPYMEGGSVAHILRYKYPEGLPELLIATIMREVLKALAYVHKQGDIHRDVKAGNVLVDGEGNVKLGDFGVAATPEREEDWRGPKTRNTFVGTPCWMAPEVLEQVYGYGTSADIWSFGITILEMAHGHAPFSKLPPMKVLLMTLQGPPPQLEACCGSRHFSRGMREVVARCLNKDPKKRPTAKDLLEHKFFKQAKDADCLKRTLLADLPPLPQRCNEIRAGKAATMWRENERAAMASHISYVTDVAHWDFNCCKGLLDAAAPAATATAAAAGADSQASSRPGSGRDQYQQQGAEGTVAPAAAAAASASSGDVVNSAAGIDQQQRLVSEGIRADGSIAAPSHSSSQPNFEGASSTGSAAVAPAETEAAAAAAAGTTPPVSPRVALCFSGGKQVATFPVSTPSTPEHSPRSSRPTTPECFAAAAAPATDSRPGTAGSGMSAKRHGRFMIIEGSAPYQGPEIADDSADACHIGSCGSIGGSAAAAAGGEKGLGQLSPITRQRSISTPEISRLEVLRVNGFESISPRAAAAEGASTSPRAAAATAAGTTSPGAAAAAEVTTSTTPRAAAGPAAAPAAATASSSSSRPMSPAAPQSGVLARLLPQSLKDSFGGEKHAESLKLHQQQKQQQQQLARPLSGSSKDASPSGEFASAATSSGSPRAAVAGGGNSSSSSAATAGGSGLCSLARPACALADIYTSAAGSAAGGVSLPRAELHSSSSIKQQQQYSSAGNSSLARSGAALCDVYPSSSSAAGSSSSSQQHYNHPAAGVWEHLKEVWSEAVAHVTQPFKSAAAASRSHSPRHSSLDEQYHQQQQMPQRSSGSAESFEAPSMLSASARSSSSSSKPPRYQAAAAAGSARHQQQQQVSAGADAGQEAPAAAAADSEPAAGMASFADTVERDADTVMALLTGTAVQPPPAAAAAADTAAAAARQRTPPDVQSAETAAQLQEQQQQQQQVASPPASDSAETQQAVDVGECAAAGAAVAQVCQQELSFSGFLQQARETPAETAAVGPAAAAAEAGGRASADTVMSPAADGSGLADAAAGTAASTMKGEAATSERQQQQQQQPNSAAATAATADAPQVQPLAAVLSSSPPDVAEAAAAAAAEEPHNLGSLSKVAVALMPVTPVKHHQQQQQQCGAAGEAEGTPVRRQRGRFTIIES